MAFWNRKPSRYPATVHRAEGLVAAAQRFDLTKDTDRAALGKLQQQWQQDVLVYADQIGEFKDAGRFVENSFRRLRLYAAFQRSTDEEPIPVMDATMRPDSADGSETELPADDVLDEKWATLAEDILAGFAARDGGQPALMARLGVNIFYIGEALIIQRGVPERRAMPGEDERSIPLVWDWEVRSPFEVKTKGTAGRGEVEVIDSPDQRAGTPVVGVDGLPPYVERIYRRHPFWSAWSDSNARAAVDVLEELRLLGLVARASLRSRAMAGVWTVPEELDFGASDLPDGSPGPAKAVTFDRTFAEAMSAGISNEADPNTVAPLIVRGSSKFLGRDVFGPIEMPRRYGADERAQREEAVLRLGRTIELPQEKTVGVQDVNHWCVDDATEVLTRDRGWVHQQSVLVGDEVRTLNHETGTSRWQPVLSIYRAEVINQQMVAMESRTHSSVTTPNHRWPVVSAVSNRREWRTTETLTQQHRVITGAPASDRPSIAKFDDALVELVAWFWTEGHINGGGGTVSIAQSHTVNPDRVDRIRAALIAAFGHEGWRESIQENRSSYGGPITIFHLRNTTSGPLLDAAPGKRPTYEFIDSLTTAQLHLFIDTSCEGDGHHWRQGIRDIWQRQSDDLNAFDYACLLAGFATSRIAAHDGGTAVRALRSTSVRPVKAAEQTKRAGGGSATVETIDYTGTIWCPVTADGTWLARRSGRSFFTGNTAWAVSEDTYRGYVEPLAMVGTDGLTYGLLHPLLLADGCPPEICMRITVQADASQLVKRSDVGKIASEGYTMSPPTISGEAWRRANGFGDDDAPDMDEMALRAAMAARQSPEVAAELLEQVGILDDMPEMPEVEQAQTTPDMEPDEEMDGMEGEQRERREPPAMAAALEAQRSSTVGSRLAAIDATLFARLVTQADLTVTRVLERLGARLRSKPANPELKAALSVARTIPNAEVAAHIPPALVAAALGPTPVTAEDFADLRIRFDRWTDAAQESAVRELARLAGGGLTDRQLASIRSRQSQDRDEGWAALLAALVAFTESRLVAAEDQIDTTGEWDPSVVVAPVTVWAALAIAGGTRIESTRLGGVQHAGGGWAGGPATGDRMRQAFADTGYPFVGYEWEYGSAPRQQPFEAHLLLDGAADSQWGSYAPGDHRWCRCSATPIVDETGAGRTPDA